MTTRDEAILKLGRDRYLAHQSLFKHRHADTTPPFHEELIELWHSVIPRLVTMAFREGAKSTLAEEAMILGCDYQLFHNAVIVGSTERRAIERLTAIKHELETNEHNASMFGEFNEHNSKVWNESEIVLRNGVRVAAIGRGQSLRGTKHLQYRPDFCFCDDIEEVEKGQVYSDEDAHETIRWFRKVLIPALDKDARIRVNATPLSQQSLPITLGKEPDWVARTYPIEYIDQHGERQPTWPSRYSLAWIDRTRASFDRLGLHHDYMQEYMCVAEDPTRKIFLPGMFKVQPRVRTWEPTWAMFDPARTTKQTSATTGWTVWSWIGNRLIVWDGGAELWKPDEITSKIFEVAETYSPVEVCVEEDGLNEFILQPLRHEMLRRGVMIPLRAVKAPRGKISFIEGLQPFFKSGEATFARELDISQFLNFPAGRIDFPNALAYAPRLRPGIVVYDNFTSASVDDVSLRSKPPVWLALNSGAGVTTGVLAQLVDGALHVVADWVREGDPGAVVRDIVVAAAMECSQPPRLVAGPHHFADYDRLGLRGAVARIPAELRRGGEPAVGRDQIRGLLQRQVRDRPALIVNPRARWTLNGLAAGYARAVDGRGVIQEEAQGGTYRTILEGLESLAALMSLGVQEDHPNVRVTEGGQRYVSALPGRSVALPAKDQLLSSGAVSDAPQFHSARRR